MAKGGKILKLEIEPNSIFGQSTKFKEDPYASTMVHQTQDPFNT